VVTESKHVEVFELVYPGPGRACDAYAVQLAKFNRDVRTKEPILGGISNFGFYDFMLNKTYED